jgi:hypothetical protein
MSNRLRPKSTGAGAFSMAGATATTAPPCAFTSFMQCMMTARGGGARLDFGTDHELCSWLVLLRRSWKMVRAVVEEAATLASLALFLGMIAIWAQVIATL